MNLLEAIENRRRKIKGLTDEINKACTTQAGAILNQELKEDRDKLYHELGRLCSNTGVKICLR